MKRDLGCWKSQLDQSADYARKHSTSSGMPLEELIVRHALGEKIAAIVREDSASGVMMIPIPSAGIYEGVENVEAAEKVEGIESIEITAKLQQKLIPLPEGASYLGFIFARGPSPEFVENEPFAKRIRNCVSDFSGVEGGLI